MISCKYKVCNQIELFSNKSGCLLDEYKPRLKKMTQKCTSRLLINEHLPSKPLSHSLETFILLEISSQNEYQLQMKATIGNVALRGHPRLPAYKRDLKLNCLKQEKATQTSTAKKAETNRRQGRSDHNNERGCKTTRR